MFRGFRLAPHAEGEPRPSAGSASVSEFAANRRGKRFWHRLLPLRLSLVVAFALAGEAAWGADFVRFEIDSTPRTGEWYAIGETIEVQAVFDSAVQASTAPATTLSLTIGDEQRIASIVGDNQGTTIEFHYQVVDGDNDTNGIEIMAGAFQGDFTDVDDGTPVNVMNAALSQQSNHRVDGVRQEVTAVKLVNPPRSGTYIRGDNIDVAVEFDGRVHVRGQPYLQLSIGSRTRTARFISGDRTNRLLFRYVVQDDDLDEDGIEVAGNLQGGTITDPVGNPVNRTLAVDLEPAGRLVNAVSQRVLSVLLTTDPGSDNTYGIDDFIEVEVEFDDIVRVSGAPELVLSLGANGGTIPGPQSQRADYVSGHETDTLLFRYHVQEGDLDEDGVSIDPNALMGGSIKDAAGNDVRRELPLSLTFPNDQVDGIRPAPVRGVEIISTPASGDTYTRGEAITLELTFSETVHLTGGPGNPVLLISIGRHTRRQAEYVTGGGSPKLRFEYIVQADDEDTDGISVGPDALCWLDNDGDGELCDVPDQLEDAAGNPVSRRIIPIREQPNHKVDGGLANPTATGASILSDPDDGLYGLGDPIRVAVDFNVPVHVRGDVQLTIAIGGRSAAADLVQGSGTTRLVFRYIVQAGDYDDDGISIGPNALVGGTIEASTGNAARRVFVELAPDSRHKVDAVPPGAAQVAIRPAGPYGLGEPINITVELNEVVYVTQDAADDPLSLLLSIGERNRRASYFSGSGSTELEFRYIVRRGDYDDDGISIGPDALVGGVIEDRAGNEWGEDERRLTPFPRNSRYRVDARREDDGAPQIKDVDFLDPSDRYGIGDKIEVQVEFYETVYVSGTPLPMLLLDIGRAQRSAELVDGSGSSRLIFAYTVQAGDLDTDGVSIGPNALVRGTIVDATGNHALREYEPVAARGSPRVRVDGIEPRVVDVDFDSQPERNDTYRIGETIRVVVQFNEPVHVTETESELRLVLSIGEHSRHADYVTGSGNRDGALVFQYTVQTGDFDDDGISIGPDALVGGLVEDVVGNDWDQSERRLPATGEDNKHMVNGGGGLVVTVANVEISSEPADGPYRLGEAIEVRIEFTEVVHVVETEGQLELLLSIGEHLRRATYVEGSGTEMLLFRYVVQDGDFDSDGISIGADALVGGSVQTEAGVPAQRAFLAEPANRSHRVDALRPTVKEDGVEIFSAGPYRLGDAIEVRIEFTAVVHVVETDGELELLLSIGEHTRRASYVKGSGREALEFRYVVQAGDFDSDGISIGTGALVGGVVQTTSGNPAQRALPALGADDDHTVNARRPTVRAARISTEPFRGDTYRVGERIEVEVEFTEDVTPSRDQDVELQLTIGSERKSASLCPDGANGRILTFCYHVELGDEDANGIAIAADALTGGEIVDGDGNVAAREIAALADQSQHKVDGSAFAGALTVALTTADGPQRHDLRDVLTVLGIRFDDAFAQPVNTDSSVVTATLDGEALVLTPIAEGTAQVRVTDGDCGLADETCAITLDFLVTVQANQAEVAVLQQALAAVGRGLLAGAANTIGARLEMGGYGPHFSVGGRRIAPLGLDAATSNLANGDLAGSDPFHPWRGASDPMRSTFPNDGGWSNGGHRAGAAPGSSRLLHGTAFEMPLVGGPKRNSSWAMWGAADFQSFSGKPEEGGYDGSMSTAYLGVDGRGDAWVAGASVSRTRAESDYDFESRAGTDNATSGKGTVSTDLTVFHPYAQWSLGEKGRAWVMGGFGTGEAELEREGADSPQPSDMAVTMGMAGVRVELGRPGGVDFALRGDVGSAQLETKDGLGALDELQVSAQRARIGLETSLPLVVEDGSALTPFLDVGARVDGGDGQTGTGVEVAAGIRFGGKSVRFEAKGRTLVMHEGETDDDYSETGGSATLMVAPGTNGRGLSLSLSPHWGASADSTDQLWRNNSAVSPRDFHKVDASWGVAGRIGYGLPMKQRQGTVTPFGEVNVAGEEQQRTKVGIRYAIDRLGGDSPMRFEFSGERVEREHGAEHRVMFTAEGRF